MPISQRRTTALPAPTMYPCCHEDKVKHFIITLCLWAAFGAAEGDGLAQTTPTPNVSPLVIERLRGDLYRVQTDDQVSARSEEHTSELQSHSFISYAVFC